jgi:hypothetical protein
MFLYVLTVAVHMLLLDVRCDSVPASHVMRNVPEYAVQFRDTKGFAGSAVTRDTVAQLMNDPHNLFLLVMSAACASSTTDECVQLFQEYPEVRQRTILVLTKLDTVEHAVLETNVQQRILKNPAPAGDSDVTKSVDVVGIINADRRGRKLDEAVWFNSMLSVGDLGDATLASHLGVSALLMAIEKKQKAHVLNCVIPHYSEQLRQELQARRNELHVLPRVPTLSEVLSRLGFSTGLKGELNETITRVSAAAQNLAERLQTEFDGFRTAAADAEHADIESFAVQQHNSTIGTDALFELAAGRVPDLAGSMIREACAAVISRSRTSADTPSVAPAVTEHLTGYAAAHITPADTAAMRDWTAARASPCKYEQKQFTQSSKAVQKPAAYHLSGAVVAVYNYIKTDAFKRWCESNVRQQYLSDYDHLLNVRGTLTSVIADYEGVIQSLRQLQQAQRI